MLLVVVGVRQWHLTRWDKRGSGGQPVALRE